MGKLFPTNACLVFTHPRKIIIKQESGIKVYVLSPKESGSVPINDVNIAWVLFDENNEEILRSNANTEEDGVVTVDLNVDGLSMSNKKPYRLTLEATKFTIVEGERVEHTFRCGEEAVECTAETSSIFTKHLQFNQEFNFIDSTASLISGTVRIVRTENKCTLSGARVCLQEKYGNKVLLALILMLMESMHCLLLLGQL